MGESQARVLLWEALQNHPGPPRTREWGTCGRWGGGGTEPRGGNKASSSIMGSEFRIGCPPPALPHSRLHPGTPPSNDQARISGMPDEGHSSLTPQTLILSPPRLGRGWAVRIGIGVCQESKETPCDIQMVSLHDRKSWALIPVSPRSGRDGGHGRGARRGEE